MGGRVGKEKVVGATTAEETAAEAGHGVRLSALQPRQVRHVQNQPRTRRGKARVFHLRCHVRLCREFVECAHRRVQRMDRRTRARERLKEPDAEVASKDGPETQGGSIKRWVDLQRDGERFRVRSVVGKRSGRRDGTQQGILPA